MKREMQGKRTATARLAVDPDEAVMRPHHVIDDGEAETGALRAAAGVGLDGEGPCAAHVEFRTLSGYCDGQQRRECQSG